MMEKNLTVDADAHVEEVEETWSYLDAEFKDRKPIPATVEDIPGLGGFNAFWVIDGRSHPKPVGRGAYIFGTPLSMTFAKKKPFSLGSQGLTNVSERLKDLDDLGVDIQVLYPTIFITSLTEDPRFEAALKRSYNTFMYEACKKSSGRLKWVAIMPLLDVEETIKELRRGKELGAVGAAVVGTLGNRMLNVPDLFPFYEEAQRLDMSICVHAAWSFPALTEMCENIYSANLISFPFPILMAFFAIVGGGILDKFPNLRFSFFEAGSEWVPYMVGRMEHYYSCGKEIGWFGLPERRPKDYLKDGKIFLTCEPEDKLLPQVAELIGEDQIMMSTDMPHAEGRESAVEIIKDRHDLSDSFKRKILGENARRFYKMD